MDARQQFRRIALAAQDRDLTSVAFAVEGEVAQPTIRMHNTAGLNRLLHEGHQTVRRSLVRTARTLPERGTQPPSSAFPTTGTAKPFRPAHPEKIITTSFLRSEALLEVRQRARIVFHGLLHYLLWLPESNGYPICVNIKRKALRNLQS